MCPPCTHRVSTLYPPCIPLSSMYPPSCMILVCIHCIDAVRSSLFRLAPLASYVCLAPPRDKLSPAPSCYAIRRPTGSPRAQDQLLMSEPKAAHLPTLFSTKLDDRAWVRLCEFELPNVRLRCTGLSMANSLERSQSGNLSRSRLASTWTNPEEHGHSRNPSGSKLSSTPSQPMAMERRWTPLPPDSPLLRSTGSFGSTGSLPSKGPHDLEHGYSGLLNLQPSETPSTVIAPGLSPARMQLHASASGSLGRAFGSLLKSCRFNGATRPSPPGRLGSSLFRPLAALRTPGESPSHSRCQRRPPRAFPIQAHTQVGWPTGRLRQRQESLAHSPRR